MIHAETLSCVAALDLDATSAVESKLFLAEILPSLPRERQSLAEVFSGVMPARLSDRRSRALTAFYATKSGRKQKYLAMKFIPA